MERKAHAPRAVAPEETVRQREGLSIRIARIQGQDDRDPRDVEERSFQFAVAVVQLLALLPANAPRHVVDRVAGLSTDIGADVAEAFNCHSKRTHLSRLESARRASRELGYWLRLIIGAELASPETIRPFLDEAHALHTMMTALCSAARQETESG